VIKLTAKGRSWKL